MSATEQALHIRGREMVQQVERRYDVQALAERIAQRVALAEAHALGEPLLGDDAPPDRGAGGEVEHGGTQVAEAPAHSHRKGTVPAGHVKQLARLGGGNEPRVVLVLVARELEQAADVVLPERVIWAAAVGWGHAAVV